MDANKTFDRLVAELPLSERKDLLRKLERQVVLSSEPLYDLSGASTSAIDMEHRFSETPWFIRLYFRILSIFKSRTAVQLYETHILNKLGASIQTRFPGLFDSKRSVLLGGFRDELQMLKESARFFYDALDGSVVRDKGAFFVFLASLEMDFIHQRLVSECDPATYSASNPGIGDQELRQQLNKTLESILATISDEQRQIMYRNVRSLLCLKELASFLFDRVLSSFSSGLRSLPSCPAYVLQDQLVYLNDILFSLTYPPSLSLLESLFVFNLQDRINEKEFDLDEETKNMVCRAGEALERIRHFHQRIPMNNLLRCILRRLDYEPQLITGGEDWFAVFRDFWRKQVEDNWSAFIKERRRDQLAEGLSVFLKGKGLVQLENIHSTKVAGQSEITIRQAFILSFLAGFHKYVFADEVNKALKPVLLDGEFYKRENRSEFTEAYNDLLKLGDAIRTLDDKLSPSGDIGKRLDLVHNEMLALPLKRRKILTLVQEAEGEASSIVERAGNNLRTLAAILNGVLNGQAGGRYDSLANLGSLGGRAGNFMPLLRNALQKTEKAVQLLGEIEALEAGR